MKIDMGSGAFDIAGKQLSYPMAKIIAIVAGTATGVSLALILFFLARA